MINISVLNLTLKIIEIEIRPKKIIIRNFLKVFISLKKAKIENTL